MIVGDKIKHKLLGEGIIQEAHGDKCLVQFFCGKLMTLKTKSLKLIE